jgi:hypothetical protein
MIPWHGRALVGLVALELLLLRSKEQRELYEALQIGGLGTTYEKLDCTGLVQNDAQPGNVAHPR